MISNNDIEKVTEIMAQKNSAYVDWMKQILILASSLFGILVAFNKNAGQNPQFVRYIYSTALVSLSLGILFGAISLSSQFRNLKKLQKLYADELIRALKQNQKPNLVQVQTSRILKFFEILCFILLCFAVLALAFYVVLITL
jgi:NAD/NADP transhydrogenase beta subunit